MTIDRPIAIALILFIILLLGFYLIAPKYQKFKELQIKLSEKEAEFKGKAAYFAQVSSTFKELKNYEESLGKIDNALPSSPSLESLIYFFQMKSSESGLIFQKANLLSVSLISKASDIKEISFFVEFFGSYLAFKNLLSSLEKSARLIEVEDISFASQTGTEQTRSFRLIIKVHSY